MRVWCATTFFSTWVAIAAPLASLGCAGAAPRLRGLVQVEAFATGSCVLSIESEAYCWGRHDEPGPDRARLVGTEVATLSRSAAARASYVHTDGTWTRGLPGEAYVGHSMPLLGETDRLADYGFRICATRGATLLCWDVEGRTVYTIELPGVPTDLAVSSVYAFVAGPFGVLAERLPPTERESAIPNPWVPEVLIEEPVEQIAVAGAYGCALLPTGRFACWAGGEALLAPRSGELPVGLVRVRGQALHTCGLDGRGQLWCWGNVGSEERAIEMGDERRTGLVPVDWPTPQLIELPGPVYDFAVGSHHSCALLEDDTVWCWGSNYRGQLGDGTGVDSAVPVRVIGLPEP